MSMFDKLAEVEARHQALEAQLADPEILARQQTFQKLAKERSDLDELVTTYRAYNDICRALEENAPPLNGFVPVGQVTVARV